MRRPAPALFIAVFFFFGINTADAAAKRKPSAPAPGPVLTRQTGSAVRVNPPLDPQKKQLNVEGEGEPPTPPVHRGPGQAGPPRELHLNKATGKKFDLRDLPFVPGPKRERPERPAPPVTPGAIETAQQAAPSAIAALSLNPRAE